MGRFFNKMIGLLLVNTFLETPFVWVCWNLVIAPLAGLGLVSFANLWVFLLVVETVYSLWRYLFG